MPIEASVLNPFAEGEPNQPADEAHDAAPVGVEETDHAPDLGVETDLTDETPAEAPVEETPQINWDTDDNPYRQRLRGLQATTQRYAEESKALKARLDLLQEQLLYTQTQHLDPEDRIRVQQEYHAARQQQMQQQRLQQQQAAITQREQEFELMARDWVVNDLSQKYGVPREVLARFDSPEEMEAAGELAKQERLRRQRELRQAKSQDRFEGQSHGGVTRQKAPANLDEAGDNFLAAVQRLGR